MNAATVGLLLAVASLAGCAAQHGGSIAGGECKVMERPPYAVRGAKPYDQDWIDGEIEGGVGACGWQRPAPRPVELDAAPASQARPVAKPAKKRGLVRRIRDKVWPGASIAPVAPVPELPERPVAEDAPAPEPPLPPPAPTPRVRRPIEELLHLTPDGE